MGKFLICFIMLLCSFFLNASSHKDDWKEYDYKFSIACIFQNDAPYLQEWIDYHIGIGVEHFYLYNNGSTDEYRKVLSKYVASGMVELIDWPDSTEQGFWGYTTQPAAYRDALKRSFFKTQWLALIDTDEFLVPMTHKKITSLFKKEFAYFKAIYAHWLMFGTGGVTCPTKKILWCLTKCAAQGNPWNSIGKSIVRPEYVETCVDPHFCILKPDVLYRGGDGKELHSGHNAKYLRINHYTFRDELFLHTIKKERAEAWGQDFGDLLDKNKDFSLLTDTKILKLLK
jgi:hypothetical protein